jgi:hypothetical protein
MIMPDKNITVRYSLLHSGAQILSELKESDTVSALRERTKHHEALSNYERFVLSLDYLFVIGALKLHNGLIVRCTDD